MVAFLAFFSLLGMLGIVVLWCTLGMISLLFSSILLLGLFCSVILGEGVGVGMVLAASALLVSCFDGSDTMTWLCSLLSMTAMTWLLSVRGRRGTWLASPCKLVVFVTAGVWCSASARGLTCSDSVKERGRLRSRLCPGLWVGGRPGRVRDVLFSPYPVRLESKRPSFVSWCSFAGYHPPIAGYATCFSCFGGGGGEGTIDSLASAGI